MRMTVVIPMKRKVQLFLPEEREDDGHDSDAAEWKE